MRKTVCSIHKIAYEIGTTCSYCDGMREDLAKLPEPEEPLEVDLDPPVSWQSVDQLLDQFIDDDDDDPMSDTGYNFPWI